jgi:very-short-patch-repair endonuclease
VAGPTVWFSGGGQKYHANDACPALADGQAKARQEGRGIHEVQRAALSSVGDGREPCLRCWPETRGWNDWSHLEHRVIRLGDRQGYELDFLTNVLRKIAALRPADVDAQHEFEYEGHYGRVDFVIVRNDIRLAIEVDGRAKSPMGEPVDDKTHVSTTRRQNALSEAGWTVLRFANSDVRLNPDLCRAAIERSLSKSAPQDAGIRAAAPPQTRAPGAGASQPEPTPVQMPTSSSSQRGRWPWIVGAAAVVGVAVLVGLALSDWDSPRSGSPDGQSCPAGLPVKGNESQSGELIYHEPGWRYYDATWPERCFADGDAAEDEGFRASKVR